MIGEHLAQLKQTAHLPRWHRDSSLELLLGLRKVSVDAELRNLIPALNTEGELERAIGPGALEDALADRSIHRIVHLVARTSSALPLAWVRPTADEVDVLFSELPNMIRQQFYWPAFPQVIFSSLCDLAQRHGIEALAHLNAPPSGWLERVAFARALGTPQPTPKLVEHATPPWIPALSPALIRDPLTGLLNRSVLSRDPHRVRLTGWSRPRILHEPCVILIDVDRMLQINDVHGSLSGDRVLVAISEELVSLFGDRVVRFGGDEFLVFWPDYNVAEAAQNAVNSIRALSISSFESPTEKIPVTISAGIASGSDAWAVLHSAEESLHRAKRNGRDRVGYV